MSTLRAANAPLSYGAFEMTVGIFANVPGPEELLAEMASAGYAGTELGPPGYLGAGNELAERLERHGLAMTGGWCPVRFSEPQHWAEDLAALGRTLDLFDAAGAGPDAHPVFGDGGSDARRSNPGRGGEDRSLRLDEAGWRRFADGLARAQELALERGYEPTFHPHTSTYVEAPQEIERFLELSDVGLRVVIADRAGALEAWRRGIFCELGDGDVDLERFFAALADTGYSGWICAEQDRIPRDDERLSESAEAQVRNREWLREHVGI